MNTNNTMADDKAKINPYSGWTQMAPSDVGEWKDPITQCDVAETKREFGGHIYAISTIVDSRGRKRHYTTIGLAQWLQVNDTDPLTREIIPFIEKWKIIRRATLLQDCPVEKFSYFNEDTDLKPLLDIAFTESGRSADILRNNILHCRIDPSIHFPCYFSFDDVDPDKRREIANAIVSDRDEGSWLIRSGSIKSVDVAAGTNTPAQSFVMVYCKDGITARIPFIYYYGYGYYCGKDFSRGTNLTVVMPDMYSITKWFFTFGDMFSSLFTLDLLKMIKVKDIDLTAYLPVEL